MASKGAETASESRTGAPRGGSARGARGGPRGPVRGARAPAPPRHRDRGRRARRPAPALCRDARPLQDRHARAAASRTRRGPCAPARTSTRGRSGSWEWPVPPRPCSRSSPASACPALAAAMLGLIALVIALAVDLPDVTASGVTTDLEIGDAEPAAGFWFELAGAVVLTAGAGVLALLLAPVDEGAAEAETLSRAPTPMLEALDEAPLTRRFYLLAGAVMVGAVLDLFDFFLIAFVVPDLADEWDLTFGQAAVMLLSAGVGAIARQHRLGACRRPPRPATPVDGRHPHVLARHRGARPGAGRRLVVHRRAAARGRRRGRRRGGDRCSARARVHAHAAADEGGRIRDHRDGAGGDHGGRGRRRGASVARGVRDRAPAGPAGLLRLSPTCRSRRAGSRTRGACARPAAWWPG